MNLILDFVKKENISLDNEFLEKLIVNSSAFRELVSNIAMKPLKDINPDLTGLLDSMISIYYNKISDSEGLEDDNYEVASYDYDENALLAELSNIESNEKLEASRAYLNEIGKIPL